VPVLRLRQGARLQQAGVRAALPTEAALVRRAPERALVAAARAPERQAARAVALADRSAPAARSPSASARGSTRSERYNPETIESVKTANAEAKP